MTLTDLYKKTERRASATQSTESAKCGTESRSSQTIGKLDMVIAFDTTGSMALYIGAVRDEVSQLVPRLFEDNDDMRLGIVAFGDYCDMDDAGHFGNAYQCVELTDNQQDLINFVRHSADTSGGDGDEFYELVLRKIVDETPWREGSTRVILLIADAMPHPIGYSYKGIISNNDINWREEARKASDKGIKIDTVTICDQSWMKELSRMTNGVSAPFESGEKTARLVEAAVLSRGSAEQRRRWDCMRAKYSEDEELDDVYASYYEEWCDGDDSIEYDKEEAKPYKGNLENCKWKYGEPMTPEWIEELSDDEVFVFGSNVLGHHNGGAARIARKKFGAKMGHPRGLQGKSYAIPTVGLSLSDIEEEVDRFCTFASIHDELTFYVTPIGCGVAGFTPKDIAPMFAPTVLMENVILPEVFWDELMKM